MKKLLLFFSFLMSTVPAPLIAGFFSTASLRIANQTPLTLYFCFYYQQRKSIEKASCVIHIPSRNAATITLPPVRFAHKRVVLASTQPTLPQQAELPHALFCIKPIPVGLWQEDDITIIYEQDMYKACASTRWQQHQKTSNLFETYIAQFAHATQSASLTPLPDALEQAYLQSRQDVISSTHANQPKQPLRTAVCASGGGFRAMFATLGFLRGLQALSLFDSTSTIATLSGSSWALATWLVSRQPLEVFASDLSLRLDKGIMHEINELYDMYTQLKQCKDLCKRPTSIIDFYGLALSYTLLKPYHPDHITLTLSDLAPFCSPITHPFPLFTAATHIDASPYCWLTFSPFAVCNLAEKVAVPTWALYRTFEKGITIDAIPEPMLGHLLGIFGSSFSVSFRDALERAPDLIKHISRSLMPLPIHEHLTSAWWVNQKLSPAQIPNFCYLSDNMVSKYEPYLNAVDGGYKNNLPLTPLLNLHQGNLDIIYILDNRLEHDMRMSNLQKAWQEAHAEGYILPELDLPSMEKNPCTILRGTKNSPTIMYFNLEADTLLAQTDHYINIHECPTYNTINFYYSSEDASRLISFVMQRLIIRKELIENELAEKQLQQTP